MSIRVVQLGSSRAADEGPRLGTVRRPPRGVQKADYARRNYYDVWLPELAPSATLFAWIRSKEWTPARWQQFARRYSKEMSAPAPRHIIETLAALSHHSNFSVGCYCDVERNCHRSLLRELLLRAGASISR
jgi:uncharacterized protein YeaO (DUF488 family)